MTTADDGLSPISTSLRIITWEDIVIIVDDGSGRPSDYLPLARYAVEYRTKYPSGFGVLNIIPPHARPPSPEAREAINRALGTAYSGLKCMCWLVEGAGFQGAMARAVLTGLRYFGGLPYPTNVTTDLGEALTWLLSHLESGDLRAGQAELVATFIGIERRPLSPR